jgi:hypothetical protein
VLLVLLVLLGGSCWCHSWCCLLVLLVLRLVLLVLLVHLACGFEPGGECLSELGSHLGCAGLMLCVSDLACCFGPGAWWRVPV